MRMTKVWTAAIAGVCLTGLSVLAIQSQKWEVHDMSRPMAPVVTPGAEYGRPPSDAIVLFDGKDLSQWTGPNGAPAKWKVENGYAEVNKTGSIATKQSFGDIQLHMEWASPAVPREESQKRGNSGLYLMGKYEVQILDSYDSPTYADGQAGSLYGQEPPMVNVCRKPGEWQTYDVIFRRPIFQDGKLVRPARVTVIHNGVVVQDAKEFHGITVHGRRTAYQPHGDEGPISLQDHNDDQPVRFRNIWVRPLKDPE